MRRGGRSGQELGEWPPALWGRNSKHFPSKIRQIVGSKWRSVKGYLLRDTF